jgi:hypothetical protein
MTLYQYMRPELNIILLKEMTSNYCTVFQHEDQRTDCEGPFFDCNPSGHRTVGRPYKNSDDDEMGRLG